nr:hypothetical protein [Mitsuokella multacida]
MNLNVYLKSGSFVSIDKLTGVKVINVIGGVDKIISDAEIEALYLAADNTYIFIGEKTTVSLRGDEILYLQLSKD